jgi:hypothetical protein
MKSKLLGLLLIVFILFLPLSGKDGIQIVGSVFGSISCPEVWPFSILDKDRNVNIEKWVETMRTIANYGGSATREITFLIPESRDTKYDKSYLPYIYHNGKFDLNQINQKYFDNLHLMVKIANDYNIKFYISIFDRCHGMMSHSPWKNNHQDFNGFYDLPDEYLHLYLKKIVDAVKMAGVDSDGKKLRFNSGYEIVNEPFSDKFPALAVKVFKYLRRRGISNRDIITGIEYLPPENKRFRAYKKAVRDAKIYDKHNPFRTVHNIKKQGFLESYRHIQKHSGRWWVSDDGEKPKLTGEWWLKKLMPFFHYRKRLRRNKFFKYNSAIESINCSNDFTGVHGISIAVYNYTGKYPDNYGKFPKGE